MKKNKRELVFKKLDSILYRVEDLKEGIEFFKQFGFKLGQIKEDIGWCNLHMENYDLCIDLWTKAPVSNEPHFLVEDVREFHRACTQAGIKVDKPPFTVLCGLCTVIKGPSDIKLTVLDLSKLKG